MEKYKNINILYEDNHLLVVTKPANIPVCPDESKDEDLLRLAMQDKLHQPYRMKLVPGLEEIINLVKPNIG